MKYFRNALGYLLSTASLDELATRDPEACRCHHFRNGGFGMELHTFGQSIWNAKNESGSACVRVTSRWIWDPDETLFSLPRTRSCKGSQLVNWKGKAGGVKPLRRAASIQYVLSHVNRSVYDAARATSVYATMAASARPLVSVHVRWGDKYREMRLRPISDYVAGVRNVTRNTAGPVDVFLTTEDRRAVDAFREAAPNEWRVLLYEAAVADVAKPAQQARNHTNSGFHSLVSLVLAMQATKFVVTSGSNWSRLMEELCLGADLASQCEIYDTTPWRPKDWRR